MTATRVKSRQDVDLDALGTDADARLAELLAARARLALDSLTDAEVAQELEHVEEEIDRVERAQERVRLARTERDRRGVLARAEAERQRREAALERARERQAKVEELAVEADKAMERLAAVTVELLGECDQRDRDLGEAGRRVAASAPRMRALALDAAFRHHLRPAPRGILQLEGASPSPRDWKPLAEGLLRPVEAKNATENGR